LQQSETAIRAASSTTHLLTEEARLTKLLYKLATRATRYGEFRPVSGKLPPLDELRNQGARRSGGQIKGLARSRSSLCSLSTLGVPAGRPANSWMRAAYRAQTCRFLATSGSIAHRRARLGQESERLADLKKGPATEPGGEGRSLRGRGLVVLGWARGQVIEAVLVACS